MNKTTILVVSLFLSLFSLGTEQVVIRITASMHVFSFIACDVVCDPRYILNSFQCSSTVTVTSITVPVYMALHLIIILVTVQELTSRESIVWVGTLLFITKERLIQFLRQYSPQNTAAIHSVLNIY